jgi:hypothetical protein
MRRPMSTGSRFSEPFRQEWLDEQQHHLDLLLKRYVVETDPKTKLKTATANAKPTPSPLDGAGKDTRGQIEAGPNARSRVRQLHNSAFTGFCRLVGFTRNFRSAGTQRLATLICNGLTGAWSQCFRNARRDAVRLCSERIGLQMRVPVGGERAGVPEEPLQES